MNKVYADAKSALAGVLKDGMTIMAGGFGLCGIPESLILAIRDSGVKNLTVVSNNCGIDGVGLGVLLDTKQIKKMISSYVGENKTFMNQFLATSSRSSSIRKARWPSASAPAAPAFPAFFTKTGVGTKIAEGKPSRNSTASATSWSAASSPTCRSSTPGSPIPRAISFTARPRAILIRRWRPPAKVTVAEVENLVEPGKIDPDHIITPGIYVQRIVHVPNQAKHIEQRTVRKRA